MIIVDQLNINDKPLLGVKVELPQAPLLLIKYDEVIIGCGYFSIETMENLGQVACTVSGVNNFDEVINSEIKEFTPQASQRGAKKGMVVREFIDSL